MMYSQPKILPFSNAIIATPHPCHHQSLAEAKFVSDHLYIATTKLVAVRPIRKALLLISALYFRWLGVQK
eukprot:scaffold50617_cov23-Prasinocladus_malaysianus.AAC.2